MADSDSKRYYWLKLKKDFFQQHQIKVLKSLPNGRLYALIYLELLAESTSHNGELRYSKTLPYDTVTLASVIDEDKDCLESAIKTLIQLELIEILEDKTIYMQEIAKLIGSETGGAERKREYRKNKKGDNVPNLSQNCLLENRVKSKEIRNNVVVGVRADETDYSECYEALDKYIPNSSMVWCETIYKYKNKLTPELITVAIKETAAANNRSCKYFVQICENWISQGFKTLEEVVDYEQKFKENKKQEKENEKKLKNKAREAYIKDIELKTKKQNNNPKDYDRPCSDYVDDFDKSALSGNFK